jgi:subtilisin-like proprotein convertase family protein
MSSALRSAIATLAASGGRRGKGLLFCVAAGNNNCPVRDLVNTRTYRFVDGGGSLRSYRGPIDRWIAAHPDVITVSASTSLRRRAAYSSWGKEISVCAPSSNFDDLFAFTPPGRGIVTTDNESFGSGTDFTPGSRFTAEFGGTSSATPTVAGVCGLVLSVNPSLRATDVRHVLQSTADKDLSQVTDTPVNEPGTFSPAGFSLWFGHGKVNAFKALQVAHARVQSQGSIDVRQQGGVDIPDTGAVVSSALQIHESGKIADLRIQVDIRHTYIGDLRVDLIDPQGSMIPLHRNTGGSADNLVRTYSSQEIPALRSLLGRSIRGTWVLQVRDTFRLDTGRLQSWRIAARLEPTSPTPAVVTH